LHSVHYLYGNIEYKQKRWTTAKASYELALKISLQNAPIHPITAAAYYSIGCVEYKKRNAEGARVWLDKALNIAQLRSPGRDDGTITRLLWKTSQVLESDAVGAYQNEANEMRIRAEMARKDLTGKGEGGVVIALDEDGLEVIDELEKSYDQLVPLFFR
jgi:tetratricopeptide (TPR) repeat protein